MGTRHTPQTGIQRYFRSPRGTSPGVIAVAPHAPSMEGSDIATPPVFHSPSPEPDHLSGTPAAFLTDMAGPSQYSGRLEEDLRTMLQALPTRSDIEALMLCIEEAHSRDIVEVRTELHWMQTKPRPHPWNSGCWLWNAPRPPTLIRPWRCSSTWRNWRCQNNLRLRSLPDAPRAEDLSATVTAIFHRLMEAPPPTMEIDEVHRALGLKSSDPDRPRDVLYKLQRYSQKEFIPRRAWEHGAI